MGLFKFKRGRECKKLVKYQSRTLEFDSNIGGGVFSLSNFRLDEAKLEHASQLIQSLDNRQYIMCTDYKHLEENDPSFREYQNRRDKILDAMTAFQYTLLAYQTDPEGQQKNLENAVKGMQKIFGLDFLDESTKTLYEGKHDEAQEKYTEANKDLNRVLERKPTSTKLDFYESLRDYLEITYRVKQNQLKVRNQLYDLLQEDTRFDLGGLEYEEMFEKLHDDMNSEELKRFRFIRQLTEDMAKYNSEMFNLLDENKSFLNDGQVLWELYDHLQIWLAKYRSKKDDPHTCLVFTGVEDEKGFPPEVEKFVLDKINELRENIEKAATTKGAKEKEPPKVLNTIPAHGVTEVPVDSLISATFSESMSLETINSSIFSVRKERESTPIEGMISISPDYKTAIFDPKVDLEPDSMYAAEISQGAKDLAGEALLSINRWSFTTTGAPRLPSSLKEQNREIIRILSEERSEKVQNLAHDTISTKKFREGQLDQLINQPSMTNTCIKFFYDGNHKKAIECFDKATEVDPNSAHAWKVKGDAFLELGMLKNQHKFLDEAIECFNKATEINRNYGSAWNNRAWALRGLGKYQEAIESFDKSIRADPNGAIAWNDKGQTLLDKLGQYREAIECFDKAIQIDPRFIEPLTYKGWAFDKLREYDKALECYDKSIEIDPNMHGACLSKAWILLNRFDNPKGALDWYNRCIEIMPTSYRAWREKGMALNLLQRYNDAKEAFDRARKIREEQQAHEQTYLGLWLIPQ